MMAELYYYDLRADDYIWIKQPSVQQVIDCIRTRDVRHEPYLQLFSVENTVEKGVQTESSARGLYMIKGKNITNVSKVYLERFYISYTAFQPAYRVWTLIEPNAIQRPEMFRFYPIDAPRWAYRFSLTISEEFATDIAVHFMKTDQLPPNMQWISNFN